MLGWEIFISRAKESKDKKNFASFGAGVSGLRWLDELVDSGLAVQTTFDGYPNTYYVSARVLLSILSGGIPTHDSPLVIGEDYVLPKGWSSEIKWDEEKALACHPDELLLLEAWDQS